MQHRLSNAGAFTQVFELVDWYGHRLKDRDYHIGLAYFFSDLAAAIHLAIAREIPFIMANIDAWQQAATDLKDRVAQLETTGDPTVMQLPLRPEWREWDETNEAEIVVGIAERFWGFHQREANDWVEDGIAVVTVGEVFDIIENTLSILARTRHGRAQTPWLAHRIEHRAIGHYYRLFGWIPRALQELRRAVRYYGEPRGIDRHAPMVARGTGPWSGGPSS